MCSDGDEYMYKKIFFFFGGGGRGVIICMGFREVLGEFYRHGYEN